MARVVILGGGFGGVKCARTLRKLLNTEKHEILLFSKENHLVFHPLLAEVAGAGLQPKDVAAPLRQLLNGVWCRSEEVLSLDLAASRIEYEAHDGTRKFMHYDQLVIACGNDANLAMIPGMEDHAFPLKKIGDALALQSHIMEQMEKAEVCDDPVKRKWYLSFIIVGGGFSGVEVAGEINDLVRRSLRYFNHIREDEVCVSLIHSRDQILPEVSPQLREFAQKQMEKSGVNLLLNCSAARATPFGVTLKDGTLIAGNTIVCTIGTSSFPLLKRLDVPKHRDRLQTNADMSLPEYSNAWSIGDCAAVINAEDNQLCPPVAQFAERQGSQVAHNIAARIFGNDTRPFRYKMMGQLCAIGGHNAVAEIMGMRISGFPAWFLWRGVYLMKLPSLAQQIKVGIEWMCDLVFPRPLAYLKTDRSRKVGRAFYAAGDFIIRQGDAGSEFFIIESGEAEVLKYSEGETQQSETEVVNRSAGFQPASKNQDGHVAANSEMDSWTLNGSAGFQPASRNQDGHVAANSEMDSCALNGSAGFQPASKTNERFVAANAEEESKAMPAVGLRARMGINPFPQLEPTMEHPGSEAWRQKNAGEETQVHMSTPNPKKKISTSYAIIDGKRYDCVAILGPGDFFGEAAVLENRPRNASVRARTNLEVTVMGNSVFSQISTTLNPFRDALLKAARRRTNIWKQLHDVREVLEIIPLKHVLEPVPHVDIRPESNVADAIAVINKNRLDFCCVVDENDHLSGIVSRSDLLRAIEVAATLPEGSEMNIKVKQIMVKNPVCITINDSAAVAVMTMREHGFKTLPVIHDQQSRALRGYIRIENIMDNVLRKMLVYDTSSGKAPRVTKEIQKMKL